MTTKINLNAADKITGLSVKTLRCYIANGVVSTYRLAPVPFGSTSMTSHKTRELVRRC